MPGLDKMISKMPPVAAAATPEAATFSFTWLSYTGSGMLIAAILSGFAMGFGPGQMLRTYGQTIRLCTYSLIT
ncbi:L-lactate permease, partial [Deinococcus sp. GbtcB9]|uniref:L-lactate permease n=1 Tax=Deinococcus sp. GbtcB9 TaxID=2824754 RepID=UPI0034CF49F3